MAAFCCWRKPRILTAHPVFTRYLSIVEAMLASHSNQLYAGQVVASLDFQGDLKPTTSEIRSLSVRNCDAARMFVLNLRTWKEKEFVRANYSIDSILQLERALAEIGDNESPAQDIDWEIHQAAWLKE